jgi:Terminase large subunit, T4likevirus-type, N-terminal
MPKPAAWEATNSRHAIDPVAFARETLGFDPDPDQARALDPYVQRGLLNCCRQWGKSTTVAVRAVHQALHTPNSLTIVAAPSARQSAELVRKATNFLRLLSLPIRGDGDNPISLLFPNGSRIVGIPGRESTVRGFSAVALLLIDEASRVPGELYQALRPMIAANPDAALWLLSTPNGRQGFFYDEWMQGGPLWTRIEAPASSCPRIRPEFLAEERNHLTEQQFRQEYQCEFIASDDSYFDPESIDDAFRFSGLPDEPGSTL